MYITVYTYIFNHLINYTQKVSKITQSIIIVEKNVTQKTKGTANFPYM